MFEKLNGVILAGGGGIHEKSALDRGPNKALVRIGGRIMLDYVVEALRGAPDMNRVVVVGPTDLEEYCHGAGLILAEPGEAPLDSLSSGLAALERDAGEAPDWVLIASSDIPLLTSAGVADFLERCQEREADFYYPIINQVTAEKAFPGVKRTYARLKEGRFTGGNIFLIRQRIIADALPQAEGFIRYRKDPVKMVRLVGLGLLLRYLLGMLTLNWAERRVSQMFGIRGAAVISSYPEIGVDVDKPSDLVLVEQKLVQR